jgi:hypothetical protein
LNSSGSHLSSISVRRTMGTGPTITCSIHISLKLLETYDSLKAHQCACMCTQACTYERLGVSQWCMYV